MGVKLMTGATGEQNIQAADDRECLAGITGLDSYIFPTGSQLKATLVDANTVTIGTGAGSLQGSRFRCSTTTTVTIQSGTQGQFRHDIVGLHFSRETSGREGLEFQVLTGEPAASEGAAADPAYTAGDLLKGDAEAFMPLYRVKLSGINAGDPEPMFSVLTPLATLEDSVPGRMFVGTVVSTVDSSSTASGHEARLFTEEEFKANFGRAFSASKDYIGVMNADGAAANTYLDSVTYFASGNIWVGVPGGVNGLSIRLNYLVVLGD